MEKKASPKRIHALDPLVVNRIAAGEVVVRPSSAVKELVENSIDAGSTAVTITIKNGGMKSFQIQDNGCGIHKDDLGIVCQRFTTSKLSKFDDLQTINTYGFRGEALASITHVGRVTITSKTEEQPCAFRASYVDGQMVSTQPGKPAIPRPCAGKQGTGILVEDLFYNMPNRRRALKSAAEEYNRILDIATKYAIHCGIGNERPTEAISITCKKAGSPTSDLHTAGKATIQDNIRQSFGSSLANELIEFTLENCDTVDGKKVWRAQREDGSDPQFAVHGMVSSANYSRKKSEYVTFINHRLVSCGSLKRALEVVYSEFLPRGGYPFVYISLSVPSQNVDVNVHPTKSEVHFLDETQIVSRIQEKVRDLLKGANESRVFYSQAVLVASESQVPQENSLESETEDIGDTSGKPVSQQRSLTSYALAGSFAKQPATRSTEKKRKVQPNKYVRTDSQSQSLQSFYGEHATPKPTVSKNRKRVVAQPIAEGSEEGSESEEDFDVIPRPKGTTRVKRTSARATPQSQNNTQSTSSSQVEAQQLTSVKELVADFKTRAHKGLTRMLKDHVFVGVVDETFALIQVGTGLYTLDYCEVARELVYQSVLLHIGCMQIITMDPPLPLGDLVEIALEANRGLSKDILKSRIDNAVNRLASFAEMLQEYFGIELQVDDGGENPVLVSLPHVVNGLVPSIGALPVFLLRLCEEVDWDDEKGCIRSIAWELAEYYAQFTHEPVIGSDGAPDSVATSEQQGKESPNVHDRGPSSALHAIVQHSVLSACRGNFFPPPEFADAKNAVVIRVAQLENLYKIFERC